MKAIFICVAVVISMLLLGCEEAVSTGEKTSSVQTGPVVSKEQERALEIIYESLADPSDRMRANAIEVVSTTGRSDIMPVIIKLLKDEAVRVRFSAAIAIGDMAYAKGALSVKRLLNDPDANVRIAAAYALAQLKKMDLSDRIYDALGSNDQTVRANAILLLGKLGDRKAIEVLKKVARDELSGDMVTAQVAESIAMLGGDENTYREIWALLISKYAEDRAMGIRAMGALGTEEAQNAILTMLHDEIIEIRLLASEQLGLLGSNVGEAEVADYMVRVSKTLNEQSRLRADLIAVVAIGHMGSSGLADFLPNFLQSQSKDMQLRAAQSVLLLNQ